MRIVFIAHVEPNCSLKKSRPWPSVAKARTASAFPLRRANGLGTDGFETSTARILPVADPTRRRLPNLRRSRAEKVSPRGYCAVSRPTNAPEVVVEKKNVD